MFLFSSFGNKADSASRVATSSPPQQLPVYQRAAALTYFTAPYPSDSTNDILEVLLSLAADKVDVTGSSLDSRVSSSGWLGRAWKQVTDYKAAQAVKTRQDDFLTAFSRQLELNPTEESSVVMVSCHCFVVSNGKLDFGTLYVTNCGLYFCAATVQAAANANAEKAAEGVELIKERVLFTDMASFLPSIVLAQKDSSAPPFIQGIPSGVVAPTALQVFTVRQSTIVQFVGLHDVVVRPPRKSAAEREKAGADAVQDAPCTDVVRKHEYALIDELPSNLDTIKFCALLWRLWTERLNELGLPLENPAARYAEPH